MDKGLPAHIEQSQQEITPAHQRDDGLDSDDVKGRDFTVAADEVPKGYYTSVNFIGSMFAIGASLGSGIGGYGYIAPILSIINADLGPSPNLTWVALGYVLATAISFTLVGRFSDIFGRRYIFIGGSALATIGCIVGATAPTINALIGAEVLIGLGAATQLSYPFATGEIVPIKYRFLANSYAAAWVIPTSCLGPITSYAFVYKTGVGWRGIFYLLIAFNAVITLAWTLFYHPPSFEMKHGKGRFKEFLLHFDYVGTILLTAGLLIFLMGISWGGSLYPWSSAYVIASIVVGFCCLVAFVLYEAYMPLKEPLVPMRMFKGRAWNIVVIIWALGASVYYSMAIIWPSMVLVLYSSGHDELWPGWAACVPNAGILLGELFVPLGALLPKKTRQISVAFFIGSVFTACMAVNTPDSPSTAMALVFIGTFFIGYCEIGCSTVSTIAIEDQREIGTAIGIASAIRSAVSTVCSTIFTTVLANRLAQTIPAIVPPALINAGLPASSVESFIAALGSGSAAAFEAVVGLTPEIQAAGAEAYKWANSEAYKTVFFTTIAFSGLGVILSIFLPDIDHMINNNVTVQLSSNKTKEQAMEGKPEQSNTLIDNRDSMLSQI